MWFMPILYLYDNLLINMHSVVSRLWWGLADFQLQKWGLADFWLQKWGLAGTWLGNTELDDHNNREAFVEGGTQIFS